MAKLEEPFFAMGKFADLPLYRIFVVVELVWFLIPLVPV
jgi:hypothetical protein